MLLVLYVVLWCNIYNHFTTPSLNYMFSISMYVFGNSRSMLKIPKLIVKSMSMCIGY